MKRIYLPHAAYLVTTNPIHRIPYFREDVFIEALAYTTEECMHIRGSILIGYKINPDHVHLIIQVGNIYNISQVMHSIKRVSSDRINQILTFSHDDNPYQAMEWTPRLIALRKKFTLKYSMKNPHEYPLFRWQKGFDDQLIRSRDQLLKSINYLQIQHIKHHLNENRGLEIADDIHNNLKFLEKKD